MALKIYFAGPNVFHPDAKKMEREIFEYCASLGIEALIPGDSGINWGHPELSEIARQIFEINRNHIINCDAVIANVTPFRGACVDDGTAWEIGFAAGIGKPIVTYGSGKRTTGEIIELVSGISEIFYNPRRDLNGFLVEEFGFSTNLMIACSVSQHVHHDFDVYQNIAKAIQKPVEIVYNKLKDK